MHLHYHYLYYLYRLIERISKEIFLFCFKLYVKDEVSKYVSNCMYECKLNWYELLLLFYVSIRLHVCISKAKYKNPLNNY